MISVVITSIKVLLMIFWVLVLLSLLSMSPLSAQYQPYVSILVAIILLVHFIEYFVMKAKVKAKTKIEMSFIKTMLWGFSHWLPLLNNK